MKDSFIILINALVNFFLGFALVIFPLELVRLLGLPETYNAFYPTLFGAVLIGTTIAMILEYNRKPLSVKGLGSGGAIAINLCAACVLAVWLTNNKLGILVRGKVILWFILSVLVIISIIELLVHIKKKR
jgi:hypothetical protein